MRLVVPSGPVSRAEPSAKTVPKRVRCALLALGFFGPCCMAGVFTMRRGSATFARVRGRVSGSGRGRSGGGEWGWLFVKVEFLDEPAQKDVAEDDGHDQRRYFKPCWDHGRNRYSIP